MSCYSSYTSSLRRTVHSILNAVLQVKVKHVAQATARDTGEKIFRADERQYSSNKISWICRERKITINSQILIIERSQNSAKKIKFFFDSPRIVRQSQLTKSRHDSTTITVCWCQMEIEANMFCLLLEINQLFEIKLLQKYWTAVLYFPKSLLFNFNFFTTLLHSVILQNWRGWYTPLV